MSVPQPIQLDVAFVYQRAVISAVLRALIQTHGVDFATDFVREHKATILVVTKRRLCGRDMRAVASEALRLGFAYNGV